MMLILPSMCRMSTIWRANTPSLQQACVVFKLLLRRTSLRAWQSVSISTGEPHMMLLNLSSANFRPANSSRNRLYFASDLDFHFEA